MGELGLQAVTIHDAHIGAQAPPCPHSRQGVPKSHSDVLMPLMPMVLPPPHRQPLVSGIPHRESLEWGGKPGTLMSSRSSRLCPLHPSQAAALCQASCTASLGWGGRPTRCSRTTPTTPTTPATPPTSTTSTPTTSACPAARSRLRPHRTSRGVRVSCPASVPLTAWRSPTATAPPRPHPMQRPRGYQSRTDTMRPLTSQGMSGQGRGSTRWMAGLRGGARRRPAGAALTAAGRARWKVGRSCLRSRVLRGQQVRAGWGRVEW